LGFGSTTLIFLCEIECAVRVIRVLSQRYEDFSE